MNDSVDAFRAKLRATIAAQRVSALAAIASQGELLANAIEQRVPDRTGRARRSISLQISDDGMTATVLAGAGIESVPVGHHREIDVGFNGMTKSEKLGVFARVVEVNLHGKDPFPHGPIEYDYLLGLEFGNHREPAHPFFFPTYRAKKRGIRSAIAEALVSPIRALWG